MKVVRDNFSRQAKVYKKYRPTYPKEVYEEILKLVKKRHECWDCGTGNGQVAFELSKYFTKVYATDISAKQLENAERKKNIIYSLERAERTNFEDNKFDLITVGQAIHWFDIEAFTKEVKRVGKNGGIISIWGYGLLRIQKNIDKIIDDFYKETLGRYWDVERKHIDERYSKIKFEFKEIKFRGELSIVVNWKRSEMEGFLNSWSSVENYKKSHNGNNPVNELMKQVGKYWEEDEIKEVKFPLFMRNGEIIK